MHNRYASDSVHPVSDPPHQRFDELPELEVVV